ncbi:MAG: hypothetical protein ACYC5K_09065 [Saccharofermentanales bacterium]
MSPKMGRPLKSNTKKNQYRIRMTDEELEKLEHCQNVTGLSKAGVIILGIDKVYQESLKKKV